ncbi:BTE_HP_G0127240.mRNA.1.CDS.1 [Saccharomyces cerevisiae]|nr:BTE_HP_G0010280.mRNA.1.CDS.1 [Saccharomyces cerevisiae]CAI5157876.1 BTE_HP_G0127240.mRNA.1.CDS.1 [Saccharomyces cerevisiae]CAI6509339.1 BTE_HP_G0010280.mRNA.1.CDS.1 [Saccharomyces cerevisiae]CAI6992291.1 BTE_HP_G0127240.mRNA.1.CDS.1 [Saccharomyces cerevisiae]
MGVSQIWEFLKPYLQDSRIPLRKFVIDFNKSQKRAPRIAIDAYGWLFECGFIQNIDISARSRSRSRSPTRSPRDSDIDSSQEYYGSRSYTTTGKAVINFISRLKELLSLNVEFLLVFDGVMKPSFKRKFNHEQNATTCDDEKEYYSSWEQHVKNHEVYGNCKGLLAPSDPEFISLVRKLLDLMNISYVIACGEGEAQCVWLQVSGAVDFILSNDSDTLVFGGEKILKNYSKFYDDFGPSSITSHSPSRHHDSKESFVTVIDLPKINKVAGKKFDRLSLLFFSVLLGADYNRGVKGLGKNKSLQLVQCEDPNFSMEFYDIFKDFNLEDLTSESLRKSRYRLFQKRLYLYCKDHSVELFGRNYPVLLNQGSFEGWPSTVAIMHYFHPIVQPYFDEEVLSDKYINMAGNGHYRNLNFNELKYFLQSLNLPQISSFDKWFHDSMHEMFLLREFLSIDESDNIGKGNMRITEEKIMNIDGGKFQIPCFKIRYTTFLPNIPISSQSPLKRSNSPSRSKSPTRRQMDIMEHPNSLWLPKYLIPQSHPLVIQYYETQQLIQKEKEKKGKKSNKSRLPQKNNLDEFLRKHTSPIKSIGKVGESRKEILEPVRKRLFVDTDEDTSLEEIPAPTRLTTVDEHSDNDDDSLIFVDEITNSQGVLDSSPGKRIRDLTQDEQVDVWKDVIEISPIKKSRTTNAEKNPPESGLKSRSSITINARLQGTKMLPPNLTAPRLEREHSSVLDQLFTDAQDTVDRFVACDSDSSSTIE